MPAPRHPHRRRLFRGRCPVPARPPGRRGVCIGAPPPRDSYLRIDTVLAAAQATGAQAVHPGYGFLAENPAFASACAVAGLVFIGPPAGAIRAMGSKSAAKQLMQRAGVPLVPGYHGDDQDAAHLQQRAREIGWPVMIKASAGGGGKGMRIVEADGDFAAALASCRREAAASFGDDRILIEKYLARPRHIEMQVFADSIRQRRAPVRARLLGAAPSPEGAGGGAGAGDDPRAARGDGCCCLRSRSRRRLRRRRHCRVHRHPAMAPSTSWR